MRNQRDSNNFFVYIIISLFVHLFIFLFVPFGSLVDMASSEGRGDQDFGFVQFVEFKTTSEVENQSETKKIVEQNKKTEESKKDKAETEKETTENEKQVEEENKNINDKKNETTKQKKVTEQAPEKTPLEKNETSVDKNKQTLKEQENKKEQINKNKTAEKKQEIITSEESDVEIEVKEEKTTETKAQEESTSNNTKEKTKEQKETQDKKEKSPQPEKRTEPAPPPPPKAGELIGVPDLYYPKDLANEEKTGSVNLAVSVTKDGEISNIKFIKSSGIDKMDNYAVNVIKRMAKIKSYESGYTLTVKFDFIIDESSGPEVKVVAEKVTFK